MSEDFEIPQDLEIPNFANKEEENEWRFEMIAKTCTNLAQRWGGRIVYYRSSIPKWLD